MFAFGVAGILFLVGRDLGDGRRVAVCCMVMVQSCFLSTSCRAAGRKSEDGVCMYCVCLLEVGFGGGMYVCGCGSLGYFWRQRLVSLWPMLQRCFWRVVARLCFHGVYVSGRFLS